MNRKQIVALSVLGGLVLVQAMSGKGGLFDVAGAAPPAEPEGFVFMGPCVTARIGDRTIYSLGGTRVSEEECRRANEGNEASINEAFAGIDGAR